MRGIALLTFLIAGAESLETKDNPNRNPLITARKAKGLQGVTGSALYQIPIQSN